MCSLRARECFTAAVFAAIFRRVITNGTGLFLSAALAAAVLLAGCRQQDIRTVTIQVPAMKNAACAQIVSEAVAWELAGNPGERPNRQLARSLQLSGLLSLDLTNRTVRVKYDSLKMSLKNIEFAIADAGFEANNTPASKSAAAQLPQDCR